MVLKLTKPKWAFGVEKEKKGFDPRMVNSKRHYFEGACWGSHVEEIEESHNLYKIDGLMLSLPIGFKMEPHVT